MDETKDKRIICPKCKTENSSDEIGEMFAGFYDGAEAKVLCSCGYMITVYLRIESWYDVS